jgi:hypothetical protein
MFPAATACSAAPRALVANSHNTASELAALGVPTTQDSRGPSGCRDRRLRPSLRRGRDSAPICPARRGADGDSGAAPDAERDTTGDRGACNARVRTWPHVQYLIVGDGEERAPSRANVRQTAAWSNRVHFAGRSRPAGSGTTMRLADLFRPPNRQDGPRRGRLRDRVPGKRPPRDCRRSAETAAGSPKRSKEGRTGLLVSGTGTVRRTRRRHPPLSPRQKSRGGNSVEQADGSVSASTFTSGAEPLGTSVGRTIAPSPSP